MPDAASFPRAVGRYVLCRELASGGMASVHLGRLLGPVGFMRTVAIKRLHPQFARDSDFVAMFLDEARLAARVSHPNVVQTLDVVAQDGELFLVMEYVPGESLSVLRRLAADRRAPIPLRVVTSILCGTLHGLHAAHGAKSERGESLNIVHRDVSPQNILVSTDGVARVLDFGVAKAVGRAHSTRDGVLKGKLAYMSPEQLQGRATQQSDVFAASIVLWEVLTGARLFAGEDDGHTVTKVLGAPIEPPSKYSVVRRDAEVSPAQIQSLDAVVLRGLARDLDERFRTAREMALALEACVGVASAAEVGLWIEDVAGEIIRRRAEVVAEVESDPTWHSPGAATLSKLGGNSQVVSLAELTRREGDAQSLATSPTVSPPRGLLPPEKTRRRTTLAVTLATVAVVSVAAALYAPRMRTASHDSDVPAPAGATSSESAASPTEAPSLPPAATSSAQPPVPETGDGSTVVTRPSPPVRPAPSRRKRDCNPPYTIDSHGEQHFKEECFH